MHDRSRRACRRRVLVVGPSHGSMAPVRALLPNRALCRHSGFPVRLITTFNLQPDSAPAGEYLKNWIRNAAAGGVVSVRGGRSVHVVRHLAGQSVERDMAIAGTGSRGPAW